MKSPFVLGSLLLPLVSQAVTASSSPGDVVGKVVAGYQGWFSVKQDTNDPNHAWTHWGDGTTNSVGVEVWPDVREYANTYQWDVNATLGNGKNATLYDAYDTQTVDVHFTWMKKYGIDVAAVQRFGTNVINPNTKDHVNGVAQKAQAAAEKHGVKFYIMWDISGWTNFTTDLPTDFLNNVKNFTSSPAYAKQNGKPVVNVWGLGLIDRPGTPDQAMTVINFLKDQGLYVILGVPTLWLTQADSKLTGFLPVFTAADMISPWTVGRYNGTDGAAAYQVQLKYDLAYCKEHGIDYQPVVFPGMAWSNWTPGALKNMIPRLHGEFLWQQFVNLRKLGIPNAYIAMFDEYNEGTAIAKAAEDSSMIPTNQYFLTLDADGVHVSSDFYLRVAGDGGRLMKHQIPVTKKVPTSYK
ncbi:hypothetical protein BGW37DRAFT_550794 [Umbelopsis sp. PMI_123]|nr:hypothetical protein BGW37DRAFT_550794 [Umbelopsis sp. PMI_123]